MLVTICRVISSDWWMGSLSMRIGTVSLPSTERERMATFGFNYLAISISLPTTPPIWMREMREAQ